MKYEIKDHFSAHAIIYETHRGIIERSFLTKYLILINSKYKM
jgi:hypothetical protein